MAASQLNAAPSPAPVPPPTLDHPMANPGYGKRSAPGQRPRTATDFAHLLPRDAAVAAYIDGLCDGADISVKTLAKTLPYGQCALRTTLNRLQEAGHLRRGSECVATEEVLIWVTRTFFSRTARGDEWWDAFTRGDAPPEHATQRPTRSRSFIFLAALGREKPALSLSQADCVTLEPQVSEWFERGATEPEILHALTEGLPPRIHHAAALVRRRLLDKLPPVRAASPAPRVVLRTLECAECRAPGNATAMPGGLCGNCRGKPDPARNGPAGAVPEHGVRARMSAVRAGLVPRAERGRH
ncbi:hypothetical protein EDD93_1635 [Streptomyces sp. 840.1]|uniref:hypothetical protein n=1 Tax=Streptomyces sp. 840.1 TaxID=2485152 RepID=UPI000F473711|nr:hypothetical protein [Streptomyces sp. 840.1]ROQ67216.1 hypothetical protein EDD93_1635 [Streptomyces sp. 840.1]